MRPIPRQDRVFVIEIGGVAALAFEAKSLTEANSLRREEWLQDELRGRQYAGKPLWDGSANLHVRNARIEEAEHFAISKASAAFDEDDLFLDYLTH